LHGVESCSYSLFYDPVLLVYSTVCSVHTDATVVITDISCMHTLQVLLLTLRKHIMLHTAHTATACQLHLLVVHTHLTHSLYVLAAHCVCLHTKHTLHCTAHYHCLLLACTNILTTLLLHLNCACELHKQTHLTHCNCIFTIYICIHTHKQTYTQQHCRLICMYKHT
jgi:hypothetical protein